MPVMDGVEASRRIRLEGPNHDTPLVALTANAMDGHRAAWDTVGVHAFLTKPINPALLAEALSQACAVSAARGGEDATGQPLRVLQA
jgi:CheY-like chemotaxis protein